MGEMGGRMKWRWCCLDTLLSLDAIDNDSKAIFGLFSQKGEEIMMAKKKEKRRIIAETCSCVYICI